MSKNNLLYLKDISKAIASIKIFIEGMNFEQFKNDDKTSSAVIRKFEIIGEATKKVPDVIKEKLLRETNKKKKVIILRPEYNTRAVLTKPLMKKTPSIQKSRLRA